MIQRFAFLLSGNLLYALAQWAVIVIIARWGNLEAQGQYSYALAVLAPVTMLLRFNLGAVLTTDSRREFRFGDYFVTRFVTSILMFAIVPLFVWLSGGTAALVQVVVALTAVKVVEGLGEIIYGQYQWEQKHSRILLSMAARSASMIAAFVIAVNFDNLATVGAALTAALCLVILLLFEWPGVGKEQRDFNPDSLGRAAAIVRRCWSLGVTMSLVSLFNYVPVYVLERYAGLEAVGRFAAVNYLWMIGVFVTTAMIQALTTQMADLFHSNPRRYLAMFSAATGVLLAGGLVVIGAASLAAEEFVVLLYGPDYSGLGRTLMLMTFGIIANAILGMLGMNLTIARAFNQMLALNVVAVSAVALLCFWLIPAHGVEGAALALVYGLMFKVVVSLVLNARIWRERAWAHAG